MLRRSHILCTLFVCATAALAFSPGQASADLLNCDATAFEATLLTAPPVTLGTANLGQPLCQLASTAGVTIPGLPLPLQASALTAQTSLTNGGTVANSAAGVLNLSVAGPNLSALTPIITAVTGQVTSALQQTPIGSVGLNATAIPGYSTLASVLPAQTIAALNQALTIGGGTTQQTLIGDVQQSLPSLLTTALDGNLLGMTVANSQANSQCVGSQARLQGASQLGALTILGQSIPLDGSAIPPLNLITSQQLTQADAGAALTQLSNDVTQAVTSALGPAATTSAGQMLIANLPAAVNTSVSPVIDGALAQLAPTLAGLVSLSVQPNHQTIANGQITQQALHVALAIAGQNIIDTALGQARASDTSPACAPAAQVAAAQLALQCTKRKLTLIDVLDRGNHVDLLGAADRSLIGHRVAISFLATHRQVATAVVAPSGFFRTTAPVPAQSVRFTNRARYQASAGGERSLNLKLMRRMVVRSISSHSGRVTIQGQLIPPLTRPVATILVERRVSCTQTVNVTRITPNANGSWKAVVAAPPGQQAAVYRLRTQVLKHRTNPKRFPTFTLPRVVALA